MKLYAVFLLCLAVLSRADTDQNIEQKAAETVKSGAQGAADRVTEIRHETSEAIEHGKEYVKEKTEPARQSLEKHGGEIKEGAQEIKHESSKNFSQVGERFSEGGSKLKEGAGETLGAIKDTAVVGAKTVGEHVGNVASGVAGVASDAVAAVSGAAIAAKDAVGKTIIGAGEAITSEQALKERRGDAIATTQEPIITTTQEPLKVKREIDEPKQHSLHRGGEMEEEKIVTSQRVERDLTESGSDRPQEQPIERPHVDDVMLARPKRYALI